MDPVLRVFVEMGYDRTADPSQVKEFSMVTPAEEFEEAREALPKAFEQSGRILAGEPHVPSLPQPVVSDSEPSPTEHPVKSVNTSSTARAVRKNVEGVAKSLSDATRPLAGVFRAVAPRAEQQAHEPAAKPKDRRGKTPVSRTVDRIAKSLGLGRTRSASSAADVAGEN